MSLASYRKRVLSEGKNITEATAFETKNIQIDFILNSPSRTDVYINMDEVNSHPCIVSDIDTINIRKFLFLPNMNIYVGDYICHDGFIYLATAQTTDDKFPQLIGQRCNFDFPIKTEEIKTIIGRHPNGQPIYKTEIIKTIKPSVFTSNIYSVSNNSSIRLQNGDMTAYLPYNKDEPIPEINQIIKVKDSQYKVADYTYENLVERYGCERGYIEVRLQRVMITQ